MLMFLEIVIPFIKANIWTIGILNQLLLDKQEIGLCSVIRNIESARPF